MARPAKVRHFRMPPLLRFILLRLLAAIPVFFGVTLICYGILVSAPGDPVRIVMGQHYDPQVATALRASWGLDRPFIVQYGRFVWRVLHGDLGQSYAKRTPVAQYLSSKFGNTLLLTLVAMCIAVCFGLVAGIVSAAWPRSPADYLMMLGAVIGISMPVFWLGMMLQLLFAGQLGWFPVSDISYPGSAAMLAARWHGSGLGLWWYMHGRHFVLPGVTLATVPMAIIARLTRSSMLEVMGQDYIRSALAKGLSYPRVVLVHALRNALIPIVTVIGNNFAVLLTGAVLTETVFSWPGLGRAMVDAITQYDYPVVMGGVLLMAGIFVAANLVVDVTYGLIDPRVRYS
jgi:ABC-type dipeptide/oligopeptide/nickel transport system permease component